MSTLYMHVHTNISATIPTNSNTCVTMHILHMCMYAHTHACMHMQNKSTPHQEAQCTDGRVLLRKEVDEGSQECFSRSQRGLSGVCSLLNGQGTLQEHPELG